MSKKKLCRSDNKFFNSNKLLLLFSCIYIVLSILLFDPTLFTGGDNAVYIILAESIINGKGYKNIYLPEESPHTQYPFGFPILLSLPILVFASNIIVLKLVVLLTGLGAFYFMYRIGEFVFEEKNNIVMLFYLSILALIVYSHRILSEMPFLCFSLGALYFLIKARTGKTIFYYIAFILATYAFFIRTAGISLVIGIMLFLLLKKQYKYLGIFVSIFLVVFIPWQIRNASIPGKVGYIDQFLTKDPYHLESGRASFIELAIRVWDNVVFYSFKALPKTVFPVLRSHLLLALAGFIFAVLILIGFVKQIKKYSVIDLYFIFGIIILLGWPTVWSSERFLLPILPIIILYLFFGLYWLAEKIRFKYLIKAVIWIVIILNFMVIIRDAKNVIPYSIAYLKGEKYAGYAQGWRNYFEIIDWIKENIPEDKIILSRKPEFVYLLSKHKSLGYPFSGNYDEIKNTIMQCDYIILDRGAAKRWLFPVIEKEPENYRLVFQTGTPEFYLLQVKK